MAARQAAQWQPEQMAPERLAYAGPQTLLTERPDGGAVDTSTESASFTSQPHAELTFATGLDTTAPAMTGERAARLAPAMDLVTAGPTPTVAAEDRVQLPGGRSPRGSFTWPKLANVSEMPAEWMPAGTMVAESATHAAPGMPMWGAMQPLVTVAPQLAPSLAPQPSPQQQLSQQQSPQQLPTESAVVPAMPTLNLSAPTTEVPRAESPASEAAPLASAADVPAMTLATALPPEVRALVDAASSRPHRAAPEPTSSDSRAATMPTSVARPSAERAADLMRAVAIGDGAGAADTSSAPPSSASVVEPRRRAMPEMPTVAPPPAPPPLSGAAARALELAKPFLRLVGGGNEATTKSATQRFFEQPQPVVAGSPASEAAKQMMAAARTQPATSTSDDRISLADLTLISLASATNQVAAAAEGSSPAPLNTGTASSGGGSQAQGGGSDGKDQVQEVENLAREAFEELQRLIAIARERSGDAWES
jgi:hypothetical protein